MSCSSSSMSSTALAAADASGLPPKVVPCEPGWKSSAVGFGNPDRANREAGSETFGHADGVRCDACLFEREEVSAPSDATLYFVEHQQGAPLRAQCPQLLQEAGLGGENATFALYGFDEYGGDGRIDQLVEARDVVELGEFEAVQHRSKTTLDFLLWSCAHAAESPAVKGVFGCNYHVPLGFFAAELFAMQACELDECLVGLCAAITK